MLSSILFYEHVVISYFVFAKKKTKNRYYIKQKYMHYEYIQICVPQKIEFINPGSKVSPSLVLLTVVDWFALP